MAASNLPIVTSFVSKDFDTRLYYKLIALWVIVEAFAGGLFHAAKLPFTGLLLSSMAISCIMMIAWHCPGKSTVLRATIIVCIFKLMLSPHSPPTAYIAVLFQGLTGQYLLRNKMFFQAGSVILGFLALTESAVQRILVLWVLYGTEFWKAVNSFIQKITREEQITNYSYLVAMTYILIHAIIGLLIGYYFSRFLRKNIKPRYSTPILEFTPEYPPKRKYKSFSFFRTLLFIGFVILILLTIQSNFYPENALLSNNKMVGIISRFILILLGWMFIISPLLKNILAYLLKKQEHKFAEEIHAIENLLPETRNMFVYCFKQSAQLKGARRIRLFLQLLYGQLISSEN